MTPDPFAIVPFSDSADEAVWELYHENSKATMFERLPSNERVSARMTANADVLPYDGYPALNLPEPEPLEKPLGETIRARRTGRGLRRCAMTLPRLASLLHHAYGVTHDLTAEGYPYPFRAVPSGGALYPLELFVHAPRTDDLPPGIYHYNPRRNAIARVVDGDRSESLARALVQPALASDAALFFFITAMFERTTFKYGERGYRFTLLEAGHVAQNLCLCATALDLAAICVGGFFDTPLNELLRMDGLTHATVYLVGIGAPA